MTFNPVLHGLRGLAAIAVLLFHWKGSYPNAALAYQKVPFLGTEWDLFFWVNMGWNGVHWFFVLSGYLLAAKLLQEQTTINGAVIARFWQRRILRIYPAVWAQLSLLLPFSYLMGIHASYDWYQVLGNYLLWSHPMPGGTQFFNGVYWTLPLELSFYLLLPFIVLLHRWLGFWTVILLGIAITLGWRFGLIWLNDTGRADIPVSMLRTVLPGMLLIFMAGYAITRFPQNMSDRTRYALLALGIAAYVFWHMWLVERRTTALRTDAFMLTWELVLGVLIAFIVALLLKPLWGFRWLGSRPLVFLGDISFGIYLWHFPVLRLLRRVVPGNWGSVEGSWMALGICIVVTLPLAVLSYRLVELPVQNWLGRRSTRQSTAT